MTFDGQNNKSLLNPGKSTEYVVKAHYLCAHTHTNAYKYVTQYTVHSTHTQYTVHSTHTQTHTHPTVVSLVRRTGCEKNLRQLRVTHEITFSRTLYPHLTHCDIFWWGCGTEYGKQNRTSSCDTIYNKKSLAVTASGGVGPKYRRVDRHSRTKGFITQNRNTHTQGTHITRVMTRRRLDTKQEPKYTEPNKTQADTMKLTRQTTERDRWKQYSSRITMTLA